MSPIFRKSTLLVAAAVVLLAGGCSAPRQSTPNAEGPSGVFRNAGEHDVTRREYQVDPPDEIVIKAPEIKELDGVRQVVRPDGKIVLEMLGEVSVVGLTPAEISARLTKLAEKTYVRPDVRVEVVANSKFVYVFGPGATKPGKLPYTGRVTVISALADAGFSLDGWPSQVRVSRPGQDGAPAATAVVDFRKVQGYGDLTQNYLLEAGDVIEVPFSPLSEINYNLSRILGPVTGATGIVTAPATISRTVSGH